LYLINLSTERSRPDDSKTSEESSICSALAQQNSSRNNRYSSEKHSLEPIALETEIEFVLETAQRFLAKKTHASRCPFCLCRAKTISSAKRQEKVPKKCLEAIK
jgi:hypothetical protein